MFCIGYTLNVMSQVRLGEFSLLACTQSKGHNQVGKVSFKHRCTVVVFTFKKISTYMRPQGSYVCQNITLCFYKKNCFPFARRLSPNCRNCKKQSKLKKGKNHQKSMFSYRFLNVPQFGSILTKPTKYC